MNTIISYAHIKHNQIAVNGKLVLHLPDKSYAEFLTETYKTLQISYPKFYKMDAQCKLAFLAMEFASKDTNFFTENDLSKTAIVLSNASASLETDQVHQKSINDKQNYFPSPAVFVYTLPNITIGEIAIRHHITGENAFFVCPQFDGELFTNYIHLLSQTNTEAVVGGWINSDNNNYEAFIFLVQNIENLNKNSIFKPLNQITITNLYNQTSWMH
ncbi:MAG: 3-oxoacyl-ACP synthase [Bacteroidia bacterium]|nr:3-oxoacyl-ACP synthase [Bacteroidia bacterium]